MDLGLNGKKVIIAGGSRGIGLACAKLFAEEGARVAICARGQEGIDAALSALNAGGDTHLGASVDMSDASAYADWISSAAKEMGGCDIFIPMASAGGGPGSEDAWRNAVEVDLMSVVRGIDAVMPSLTESDCGAIVAIGTTAALEEFGGPQPYNSIKAAVINYAANLAQSLAPQNIRVNTVSPGPVYIEGGSWNWVKDNYPDMYHGTLGVIPMGRFGNAEEVAKAIVFAASPAVPFMTGTNIVVDGAITKRIQY